MKKNGKEFLKYFPFEEYSLLMLAVHHYNLILPPVARNPIAENLRRLVLNVSHIVICSANGYNSSGKS